MRICLLLFAFWQGAVQQPLTEVEVRTAMTKAGVTNDVLVQLEAAIVTALEVSRVFEIVKNVHASAGAGAGAAGRPLTEAEWTEATFEDSLDSMGRLAVHSVPTGGNVRVDTYSWNSPTDANGFAVAGTRTISVDHAGRRITIKCDVKRERTSTVRIDFNAGTSVCEPGK